MPNEISGTPTVVDTSRLTIRGRDIRLLGVAPMTGRPARALARHLAHRSVDCVYATRNRFRCQVGSDDLASTIIANGGSETTADAPDDLVAAQHDAVVNGRGIWGDR